MWIHGDPWRSMKIPWRPMETHGDLWRPMEIPWRSHVDTGRPMEIPWRPMEIHGDPMWTHGDPMEIPWRFFSEPLHKTDNQCSECLKCPEHPVRSEHPEYSEGSEHSEHPENSVSSDRLNVFNPFKRSHAKFSFLTQLYSQGEGSLGRAQHAAGPRYTPISPKRPSSTPGCTVALLYIQNESGPGGFEGPNLLNTFV